MALSNDLISEFVKLTNDEPEAPKSTTVYGTVVESDGSKWVQLDGSPDGLLTPIETTTEVSQDDRVIVDIKDHTAVVTGNLTEPAINKDSSVDNGDGSSTKISDLGIVIADKVSTKELKAETARIDNLIAKDVEIDGKLSANEASIDELEVGVANIQGELTAAKGDIKDLDAEVVNVKDTLTAANAKIDTLEANDAEFENVKADYAEFKSTTTASLEAKEADIENLQADKLDATWANIDYANIDIGRFEEFFAKTGIIGDIVVDNQHITGTLVGVSIKGNLIEADTIVANSLVFLGENGLYYKLNASGVTEDSVDDEGVKIEQTEYNSLNGRIITAKSITAEQINVSDLIAFDATIGGFIIGSDSIFSGVKNEVNNTTCGIYLDTKGQFAVGDSNSFIKYYRDAAYYTLESNFNSDISENRVPIDVALWNVKHTGLYTDTDKEKCIIYPPGVYTKQTIVTDSSIDSTAIELDITTDTGETVCTRSDMPRYYCKDVDGQWWSVIATPSIDISYYPNASSFCIYAAYVDKFKLEIAADSVLFTDTGIDKLKKLNEHVKIGSYTDPETGDTDPCLELFEDESATVQRQTNKRTSFIDDEIEKTSIGIDGITTDGEVRHVVNTEDYKGQYVWATRANGNFGLMWKDVVN